VDAKGGGTFRKTFRNFATGNEHSVGGEYLELVSHERICYTDRFDDVNLPGEMRTTTTVKAVLCGDSDGAPDSRLDKGVCPVVCRHEWAPCRIPQSGRRAEATPQPTATA